MVLKDGGNVEQELDNLTKKYPNQNIDKNKILNKFIQQING